MRTNVIVDCENEDVAQAVLKLLENIDNEPLNVHHVWTSGNIVIINANEDE
jgi:RNase P/RNase MRP subunit POP5